MCACAIFLESFTAHIVICTIPTNYFSVFHFDRYLFPQSCLPVSSMTWCLYGFQPVTPWMSTLFWHLCCFLIMIPSSYSHTQLSDYHFLAFHLSFSCYVMWGLYSFHPSHKGGQQFFRLSYFTFMIISSPYSHRQLSH